MKRLLENDGLLILLSGLALGALGAALSFWGNPSNSGICISCFMENMAGAVRLHSNSRMAYLRPELAGFVLGAFAMSLAGREHRPRVGRFPLLGFVLGFFLVAGSSVFMGCPIKMALRLGAGDLTAAAGFAGLAAGVGTGAFFFRAGLDLGASTPSPGTFQAVLAPAAFAGLLGLSLAFPSVLASSVTGPGSQRAPLVLALASGLIIGALAQRSRFCVTGSLSNLFLARDWSLMKGLFALLASALAVNLAVGAFRPGILDQPGAHPDHLWNFLAMGLVGFASVLAGGCPFRQLVLAGEGAVDAALVVAGMAAAAGLVHAWGIASTSAGPTAAGRAAVMAGLVTCFAMVRLHRREVP